MFIINGTSAESIAQLIGTILIFVLVLVLSYFAARIAGTYQSNVINKRSNIRVIETYRIANNKFIQIIKLADKYIAIGIGKDNIEFLMQLEEDALKQPEVPVKPLNFKDVLAQIKLKKQNDGEKNEEE